MTDLPDHIPDIYEHPSYLYVTTFLIIILDGVLLEIQGLFCYF